MRKYAWIIIPLAWFLSACRSNQPADRIPEPPLPSAALENTQITTDCEPVLPGIQPDKDAYSTVVEPFQVSGPTGNQIFGLIRRPDPAFYPNSCFPAVVLVPGGINPGRLLAYGRDANLLAGSGMVVVTFNAEGRSDDSPEDLRSEGTEDYNGFRHQEGLCHIVNYVLELPYTLKDNIGLSTQSYGITMGAGCAGRHPELPLKYIVDGEGPPDSFVTCHGPRFLAGELEKYRTVSKIFPRQAVWQDTSQENQDWWQEREAINYIREFRGYYLRLQAQWDHAQPPEQGDDPAGYHFPEGWPGGGPAWWHNKHTTDMVNAALAGGVPWVRVNLPAQGNEVNAVYRSDQPPVYLPGMLADRPWAVQAILEMVHIGELPQ